ncbi:leucine-rich repeat-containing protein 41 isoform X2 [Gallus gallus]|uniref:leucine-rich repeat-containing protein 41 isoform X2 n=1 Tax=Gallus gallus TaxID=9031 RepID=UPI001AE1350B|nr:leucine-rich repeat-containing protein 41 isoform X2 [Gallus gallus]
MASPREAMSAEGPHSLQALSAAAVSRSMAALEPDVWALPGHLLRGLLPLLSVFRLERAEAAARRAGLSTQPIWRKLWDDVMKTRPPNSENIPCWRKKFFETFFSNVLHGVLDVSSDWRLNDRHFSPLLHSSPHVSQLTLCNMLQGAVELAAEHNQKVLENLASSLRILKFQHLLSSDQSIRRSLVLLLHRLIHHGSVSHVSMCAWPVPDTVLLVLILSMSAGFWRSGNALTYHSSPCGLCREEGDTQSQKSTQERPEKGCCSEREWSDGEHQKESPRALEKADMQAEVNGCVAGTGQNTALSGLNCFPLEKQACEEASIKVSCDHTSRQGSSCFSEQLSHHSALRKSRRRTKSAVGKKRRCLRRSRGLCADLDDLYDFVFTVAREDNSVSIDQNTITEGENADNLTSSSTGSPCCGHVGCKRRGGSTGIFSLKAAHRFRSVSTLELFSIPLSDDTCRTLSNLLSSWVSLENLVLSYNECNPNLKKLSFHDVNLADHQKEVLLLLQDPMLQEITFSFCRLFESCTTEFLSEIINTVKRNSSLKSLKLPGNRLGNHRLVALADIFSEDSSSSLCQLDVSSNCIKPDGLLEFTKKLEGYIQQRGGKIQFTHLRLFQNWLDQDAETAQEALRRLRAVCSVVNDSWDSSQAFADYISVM